jgi:ParB-like chromosome segregation protein Spo0J
MKRVVQLINISNIRKLDKYPIVPRTLDLANKLRDGILTVHDLPPIHTKLEEGAHVILDGRHRYTAIKLAGIDKIKSKFSIL